MIPRLPSSSPSIQPVLGKAPTSSSSCASTCSATVTSSLSSSSSLHTCDRCVTFDEASNTVAHTLRIYDYTGQEIDQCWWDVDELHDIKRECQTEAKNYRKNNKNDGNSNHTDQRGLERFTNAARAPKLEMAREAILYDHCIENYIMSSKVTLREAQQRAKLDASVVDRTELPVLLQELGNTMNEQRVEKKGDLTAAATNATTFRTKINALIKRRAPARAA